MNNSHKVGVFSSELRPASEAGLLSLSALGSITSDITLAAAALAELVKIGQKGWFMNNFY